MSFSSALQLLLIAFKLTDVIDWSWFFVLLPTIFGAVCVTVWVVYRIFAETRPRHSRR